MDIKYGGMGMKKTNFAGYDTASEYDIRDFNRTWISANRGKLYTVLKHKTNGMCQVDAYDKKTNELLASVEVPSNEANSFELLQKDFSARPFKCNIVAKPGDKVFFINPEFTGEDNRMGLKMLKENIVEITVKSVGGADDLDFVLTGYDASGNTYGAVQEVAFLNREDAEEACEISPADGWDSWEEYKKDVGYLVSYMYEVSIPIMYGEEIKHLKSKAVRVVAEMNSETKVCVQVQVAPVARISGEIIPLDELTDEVEVVRPDRGMGLGFETFYNENKVELIVNSMTLMCTYRKLESEYIYVKKHNIERMKRKIEQKREELLKEIAHAQGCGDDCTANYVKSLELQCSAELRLIYNLEKYGFDVDKFTMC